MPWTPAAQPAISSAPTAGSSGRMAVHPVSDRRSVTWPTRTPGITAALYQMLAGPDPVVLVSMQHAEGGPRRGGAERGRDAGPSSAAASVGAHRRLPRAGRAVDRAVGQMVRRPARWREAPEVVDARLQGGRGPAAAGRACP